MTLEKSIEFFRKKRRKAKKLNYVVKWQKSSLGGGEFFLFGLIVAGGVLFCFYEYFLLNHFSPNMSLFIITLPVSAPMAMLIYKIYILPLKHSYDSRFSDTEFSIYIGKATGNFADRYHSTGINKGKDVSLFLGDCCQNIVCYGGIGSGKTTRVIQPLLIQLLDQDCGGLIFDIKGDFKNAVKASCTALNRKVLTIGINDENFNIIKGLTPEVASSFLKSALLLAGKSSDPFWIDTAGELIKNTLGVLSFLPEHYNLKALNDYIFKVNCEEIDDALIVAEANFTPDESRLFDSYLNYIVSVYDSFDDKVKTNVNATIAQVLSSFSHPDLVDSFCYSTNDIDFENILNGDIFLVDLPLQIYGLGAKTVYTMIKLRFFNLMQQRAIKDVNQDRPVFFMCDEYQEIISCASNALSDLNFWDKSRSSKTIGIISGQSLSAFYSKADKPLIDTFLSNFRQKICFKTEDHTTIDSFAKLFGKVDIKQSGFSKTDYSTNGQTETLNIVEKEVMTAQKFRAMGDNKSVVALQVGNTSNDDILVLQPVFI